MGNNSMNHLNDDDLAQVLGGTGENEIKVYNEEAIDLDKLISEQESDPQPRLGRYIGHR